MTRDGTPSHAAPLARGPFAPVPSAGGPFAPGRCAGGPFAAFTAGPSAGEGCVEKCTLYGALVDTPPRKSRRDRAPVLRWALRQRWARLRRGLARRERGRFRRVPRVAFADARGQSAVELIALMPLLVALALGLLTLLAAGRAHEDAAQAAEAGAVALLHDGDPRAAACAALGRPQRCRAGVRIAGRQVTVSVQPHGPIRALNRELQATETADVGPGAAP